ncbi:MAG: 2-succinyl-5-enolpyruvyl-6-hydroxy-3-cyclohexene-1-carboxylic-acid synthase [Cyanobium sp.]
MGSGAEPLQPPADSAGRIAAGALLPEANVAAALQLLAVLQARGLRHLVLCPGSRSAPLAVAAALLEPTGLRLHTGIDERSAGFFALGLGRAEAVAAAVVTTSGTAVAQLLAAAVEADLGTIPLLLLSADRPERLKRCGANQAVPQEHFLQASARLVLQGPAQGLATASPAQLQQLAAIAMAAAAGDGRQRPAGAVHLNLPFEEPLHADGEALERLQALALEARQSATAPEGQSGESEGWAASGQGSLEEAAAALERHWQAAPLARSFQANLHGLPPPTRVPPRLDPDRPGVVVAGPWRGTPQQWPEHCRALIRWQQRSGWPVLADPLSGLWGVPGLQLVATYDLLLEAPRPDLMASQVLRLGTLPASWRLERWLQTCAGDQVLVSCGDPRCLDPLGTVPPQGQWSAGLPSWLRGQSDATPDREPSPASLALAQRWRLAESIAQQNLEDALLPLAIRPGREGAPEAAVAPLPAAPATAPDTAAAAVQDDAPNGPLNRALAEAPAEPAPSDPGGRISEPWLARSLSRLLPPGLPLMLASSSSVRDWASFADPRGPWRPLFGFRGASGIDGTLSIACGLAEALGQLVLISGDLALLHDANGWLWNRRLRGRLTVVLIENGGGGIFEQLPIRPPSAQQLDFERLFAMPQAIDQLALAALHGVPGRRLHHPGHLAADLEWALAQPCALLEVRSQRLADAQGRQRLRQQIAAATA